MSVWNVWHAARWICRTQKSPKIAIWTPSHNFVGLYLCNQGTYRQSEKKLVKQQYVHKMSPQYGDIVNIGPTAEIGPVVLGIPGNFNGCRVLTALLHGSQVMSISQTLQHWTEGATYVRQRDHHVGHWPTFLVVSPSLPVRDRNILDIQIRSVYT